MIVKCDLLDAGPLPRRGSGTSAEVEIEAFPLQPGAADHDERALFAWLTPDEVDHARRSNEPSGSSRPWDVLRTKSRRCNGAGLEALPALRFVVRPPNQRQREQSRGPEASHHSPDADAYVG